jgi:predicted transglutaminase-like cysteine proteinase
MLDAARREGPQALDGARALQALLRASRDRPDDAQLRAVNDFFNTRIAARDDLALWGQADRWSSPLETLAKGAGDCEDFAIAKYFGLLALGMPAHKLRLVYARAHTGGGPRAHMVLAYHADPGADPLILDNLVGDVRPASRRPDLSPVFSFNSEGLWTGAAAASSGDPVERLSRWREILAKARAEGFE